MRRIVITLIAAILLLCSCSGEKYECETIIQPNGYTTFIVKNGPTRTEETIDISASEELVMRMSGDHNMILDIFLSRVEYDEKAEIAIVSGKVLSRTSYCVQYAEYQDVPICNYFTISEFEITQVLKTLKCDLNEGEVIKVYEHYAYRESESGELIIVPSTFADKYYPIGNDETILELCREIGREAIFWKIPDAVLEQYGDKISGSWAEMRHYSAYDHNGDKIKTFEQFKAYLETLGLWRYDYNKDLK